MNSKPGDQNHQKYVNSTEYAKKYLWQKDLFKRNKSESFKTLDWIPGACATQKRRSLKERTPVE